MSEGEVNINEIAGHAAADLVESFFSNVGNMTKEQLAKRKVSVGIGFKKYLKEAVAKYSRYKTLISRHDPIELKDSYVPVRIRTGGESQRYEDFFERVVEKKRMIVEGTAGLGKTLFVKHLFRHTVLNERRFIPILFELRNLHLNNSQTLLANLVKQVAPHVPGFNEEHLKFGMEKGKFFIFLDGIDEISIEDRTRYASEILDLSYRYPDAPFLLSSRPDDFYVPWESFEVARLLPMTREQTVSMLGRLKFDPEIKEKFIEQITPAYFNDHAEFLSVPLLATLMMLTFSEFSAVPSRIHVFYEQAFQTLFHKHDFIKGAFQRKIESGLDIAQFRQVLAAFCFISYLEERFSFLQFQAIENIEAAVKLQRVECETDAFLTDLLVTVCLLQRDGTYISFVHRSFQEYFAALFLTQSPPADIFGIVEGLVRRGKIDAVLRIALQQNDGVVEREWVIPKLRKMEKQLPAASSSDYDLVKAVFGAPLFKLGLIFESGAKIDKNSFLLILRQYGNCDIGTPGDEKYYDDARKIHQYLEIQREHREAGLDYNRAALAAQKRGLDTDVYNLATLPTDLMESLQSLRDLANAIRQLRPIREALEVKQGERSSDIRELLGKYK
ncbi:NACHT domain-containing protein [Rhizobium leguminosarum]|uniref:NACHT domain-containing protein n=1 Tax=Rhizobium leguminosarum TaxID=384 RepID=UPI0014410368|nr:NACHT domain-containing protein [Rhizobium leguminosarum]NKM95687.1 NACHT domain-containing protein [Rhizobium leguminosarum bv. viciae]